jgi:hypothetical protein
MRLSPRILIPLVGVAVVWALLLGAARVRLDNDRHYCTNYVVHAPDGTPSIAAGLEPGCVQRREAARWGPYHLFGSN